MSKSRRFAIETSPSESSRSTLNQEERFKLAARELGCDEDDAHFDDALKKVARHKPFQQKSKLAKKSEKK
jgi:hypothetical protein